MKRHWMALALALPLAGCSDDTRPAAEVTFSDVAPLFAEHCNGCHRDGGIAPFNLTSWAEAAPHAAAIKRAVEDRTMPPWGVDDSGECQSYLGSRWLDDGDIDAIAGWVDAGAPGAAEDRAAAAVSAHLDDATHSLAMAEPYTPSTSAEDDYRCFVLDGVASDAFVTAYEIVPGEPSVVHHVILFALISDEADAEAEALDAAEDGAGYTCFGGPGVSFGDVRFLAGWAPGTGATRYPEGTGILLKGGHKVVMQVHYNVALGALADRTEVAVVLEDHIAEPAEVLPIVDLEMELAPGMAAATASSEVLVEDARAQLLGVYPHMHTRGQTLRVERERAGDTTCVVDVPRWDFAWQQFYFYEHPLDVQPGDIFRLRCVYDTRGESSPIRWGEGTGDEMCLAGFYLTPPLVGSD